MKTKSIYWGILCLFFLSIQLNAQPGNAAGNSVMEEKEKFIRNFKTISIDSTIIFPLARYFDREVNNIYLSINSRRKLSTLDKEKAIRSLVYFIQELSNTVTKTKLEIYGIPGAVTTYNDILTALLTHKPITPILMDMEPGRSQLMATAFSQYKEYSMMDDVAIYKRVSSSPEFILQFLESKPGFRYADSLLLDAAAHDPLRIVYYLKRDKPGVQDRIRNTRNIYLREITLLAQDKNASELLPFVTQIADGSITKDSIIQARTDITNYFQLLVNTLHETVDPRTADPIFLKPLRRGIRQKALAFYVNEINERHNDAESFRFASVKNLRPEDLYYIITSGDQDLYTSSYLGLYKRLMEYFKGSTADSLFDLVKYDQYRVFIRMAANYNVLGDFLKNLSPEKMKDVMRRFITGVETDEKTAIEKAMDVADSYSAIGSAPEIDDLIKSELEYNLNSSKKSHQYLGIRLYGILLQVYDMVKQKDGMHGLWDMLGNYEVLKRKALENPNGEVVQMVLFYGDEDGVASFNNFMRFYNDNKKWEVKKTNKWVSIRSLSDKPLVIYANLPLEIKDELDIQAQDSMIQDIKDHSLYPTMIVHRGHSYHLDKTLRRLTPSIKLAILGSCGGYNKAISIATINSDIQVIGSKKTGSKSINDPILDEIDNVLIGGNDLDWPEVWKKLSERFGKDPASLSLFSEYFPPSDNLGLFVLKLFNYYNKFAKAPVISQTVGTN